MTARTSGLVMLAAGALALTGTPAEAQLSVDLQLVWHWGDDGWRAERYHRDTRSVYAPPVRRAVPRAVPRPSIHIPPGHLPPPGQCRLWVIGRPPGHQPPPTSCARLFRFHRQPGVIVLGAPPARSYEPAWGFAPEWRDPYRWGEARRYGDRYEYGRYDDTWDDRDDHRRGPPGRGKSRGRGRGNGRGG